jgi:hypothetical protein
MSRYQLTPRSGYENYLCVIGWDRPLATYFAQVIATSDHDDDIEVFWQGSDHAECPRPDELLAALAKWAVVPPELKAKLLQDRLEAPAPLQPHPWIQHQRSTKESR